MTPGAVLVDSNVLLDVLTVDPRWGERHWSILRSLLVEAQSFNSRYWVFAAGLTDVEVTIRVVDTRTGALKTYVNPRGVPFQPIQDTSAFATCP